MYCYNKYCMEIRMGDSIINIAFLTGFYIDCVTMKSFFEESAHVFFSPNCKLHWYFNNITILYNYEINWLTKLVNSPYISFDIQPLICNYISNMHFNNWSTDVLPVQHRKQCYLPVSKEHESSIEHWPYKLNFIVLNFPLINMWHCIFIILIWINR